MKARLHALLVLVLVLVLMLVSRAAHAEPRIVLSLPDGSLGPVELAPVVGGWAGTFSLQNDGDQPLKISRVAVRNDDADSALRRVNVAFDDGSTAATLAPHTAAKAQILWTPEKDTRTTRLFGHVVITSTAERAGEVAMGFHASTARSARWLTDHVLSWMLLLPLLAAGLCLLGLVAGAEDRLARLAPRASLAVACVVAVLAWGAARLFDPTLGHAGGTGGFQLVERAIYARSIGCEYFVGIDGENLPWLLATAFVAPAGLLVPPRRDVAAYAALYLVLLASLLGAVVALDLLLLLLFVGSAAVCVYLLVARWGKADARAAALRFLVFVLVGLVLLGGGIALLQQHADRGFLVDGTAAPHPFALTELGRVSYAAKPVLVLGVPLIKMAWALVFVAAALFAGAFPFHGYLPSLFASAPPAVAALFVVGFQRLGIHLLFRVALPIMPEGTRWAAPVILALGAGGAIYASLVCLGQKHLLRAVAFASVAQTGLSLVAIASLTPQGMTGAVLLGLSQGVGLAAVFLLAGALERRSVDLALEGIRGALSGAPLLGVALLVALACVAGLPGTVGFWGVALGLIGATPRAPLSALAGAVALIVVAAALSRYALGAWQRSEARPRDLDAREFGSIAILLLAMLVLGVAPGLVVDASAQAVREAGEAIDPSGVDATGR